MEHNCYIDTRGNVKTPLSFTEALVKGLAQGGGLFVPQNLPSFGLDEIIALADLPYAQRAAKVYQAALAWTYECLQRYGASVLAELLQRERPEAP